MPLADGFLLRSFDMLMVLCSLPFAYLPFLECQSLCCMRIFGSWALVSGLKYENRIRLLKGCRIAVGRLKERVFSP